MSARQLNRLAKAKGLDPLLGGGLNEESEESDGRSDSDSEEEGGEFSRGGVVSASVSLMPTATAADNTRFRRAMHTPVVDM